MILLDTNIIIRIMRGDETVGRHYCANLGDLAIPVAVSCGAALALVFAAYVLRRTRV